jgi:hypothetical protein
MRVAIFLMFTRQPVGWPADDERDGVGRPVEAGKGNSKFCHAVDDIAIHSATPEKSTLARFELPNLGKVSAGFLRVSRLSSPAKKFPRNQWRIFAAEY